MRIFKITAIAAALLVGGLFAYVHYFGPRLWVEQTRRDSIRELSIARTPTELKSAVTPLGAFVTPTNGGWMAIRYRDTHGSGVRSLAIALDSDGRWFECGRHFCGAFAYAAGNFAHEIELREELKRVPDAETAALLDPKMNDLVPLFTAANLDSARRQMAVLGFKEFKP
jgi:hypothetical protein